MSTRRITVDLPVSIFRQLSEQAKLNHQSIEKAATQILANNLPVAPKSAIKREQVLEIVTAHQEKLKEMGIKSLELFGSVARDEAGPDSDIDFLVEFDRPVGWDFFTVQHYLEDILNCPVDLGSKDSLREHLRTPVLKDTIRVI